jgi:hypothetical protein
MTEKQKSMKRKYEKEKRVLETNPRSKLSQSSENCLPTTLCFWDNLLL